MSSLPTEGPILAIDLGDVRIGIACSNPAQSVAHPVTTLTRRRGRRFPMQALKAALETHRPAGVVIGLPLDADGSEGARAAEARAIGAQVTERSGLPVEFWDERMSTARVLAARKEAGGRRRERGRRAPVDALAATVILQTFLDARRS